MGVVRNVVNGYVSKMILSFMIVMSIVVLAGGMLLISPYLMSIGQDFTVKSISTTKIISNDADVAGAFFMVDTILGGGQHIVGEVSQSDFKHMSGYETKQPLTIKADTQTEIIDYRIINDNRGIYKYTVTQMKTCPTSTAYKIPLTGRWMGIPIFNEFICVSKLQYATKGSFDNPSVSFDADITLKVGAKEITEKIGSHSSSVSFIDNGNTHATAQWTGSLVTGDQAPNQDNYAPYFYSEFYGANNKWYVAKSLDYNEWMASETTTDSQLQQYVAHPDDFNCDSAEHCTRIIENLVDTPNWRMNKILNSDYKISTYADKINEESSTGSSVRVMLDRNINAPNILFRVKADWLGVNIPVSEPIIVSVSSTEFGSGEQGRINVQIENRGDVGATFTSTFYGCDPFMMAYSSPKTYIEAHNTGDVILFISSGVANYDSSKTCTVKVADFNKPSNYDTAQVSVSMTRAKVCTPNKYDVIGNCIWQCNSAGTRTDNIECCDYGIGYEMGKADSYDGFFCKDEPVIGDCVTDADCDDNNFDTIDMCETDIFGKSICKHYISGTCRTDTDCDDGNWLTIDKCDKSFIGGVIGSNGKCSNFDIRPVLAVLGIVLMIFFFIAIAAVSFGGFAMLKKKK